MCIKEKDNKESLINSIIHPHLDAVFLTVRLKYCVTEENKTICSSRIEFIHLFNKYLLSTYSVQAVFQAVGIQC